MEKHFIKVETKDRLPTEDGVYNVEPIKYKIHFIVGNEKCKEEWIRKIAVWHEEKPDYSDEALKILTEMYSDLEIPQRYMTRIKEFLKIIH